MANLDALPDDLRDFLVALADAKVEFVLIGGWAVAVHGRPRATEDLDVFVRPSPENASRVYGALVAFGAPVSTHGVGEQLFAEADYGYRFGIKPNLIEVLTAISGVDFDTAAAQALSVDVEGRRVPVIGHAALLANKRAANRDKDRDDVLWLEANPPRGR